MKTSRIIMALLSAMIAISACGSRQEAAKKEAPKMLVLYYSQTSNTKALAQEIAKKTGADIEAIVPVKPYDGDFQATIARCNQDREQGVKPEIKAVAADVSKYDVIFIGYPVWFGTYAPPVAAFLDKADLSGKKVVPFCTFGSGGLDSSVRDLVKAQPKAEILTGYGVRAARMAAMPKEVDNFLKAGGFIEGEYTKLEPFPEQHPVSDEEAAVFDKAVAGYPMINATAKTVAQRTIPGGKEYLFTAADKPRNGGPQMPPQGEMKVYVTVLDGAAPEFTQVIR